MILRRASERLLAAALGRLGALAPLDQEAGRALELALERPRHFRARRELLSEGREVTEALLILSGWAARVRVLEDGRRQVLGFLLPGDLIGLNYQECPLASSTVVAINDVDACVAPDASESPALASAYAQGRALDEAYLLSHITRLGRLNAQERMADLFLELLERLEPAGLAAQGRYVMPLTQEILADTLGLTSVHINRTAQTLRREGWVDWKGRDLHLPDAEGLRRSIGRARLRVSAG